MNSSTISILIALSTTWMLRMLDHHHHHKLMAQALVTQAKQECLLEGIEAYVRAYCVQQGALPSQLTFLYNNEEVVLSLINNEHSVSIVFTTRGKFYKRDILFKPS